jgi:hypothetical protein
MSYKLDDRGWISCRRRYFSLRHRIQTGSGVHLASYPMGTGGYFPWSKVARARS